MSHSCQLIVDSPASGPWNMAGDEALLEYAGQSGRAVLRLYRWEQPTLSLGYFQPYELRQTHPASLDAQVVRRQSGGGAILHDQEITYTIVVPHTHPWADNTQLLYDTFHRTLIDWLGETACDSLNGKRVALCDQSVADAADQNAFLCFQRRSIGDVLLIDSKTAAGHKIVGSAQRRRRAAVLQHGSILWESSRFAPENCGFAQLAGVSTSLEVALESLVDHFISFVPQMMEQIDMPREVHDLATSLLASRYTQTAWTKRR